MVKETAQCGAVRHGAECFNFYFPQEMDDEFLVVWDGLVGTDGVPWKKHTESSLRAFLLERIEEGYAFPLNPIWPIRDPGWYQIFDTLRRSEQCQPGKATFESWYTPEVVERIQSAYNRIRWCRVRFAIRQHARQERNTMSAEELRALGLMKN